MMAKNNAPSWVMGCIMPGIIRVCIYEKLSRKWMVPLTTPEYLIARGLREFG